MKKQLGLWTLTALVTGNMIGSGVFLLPSSLAQLGTITIFSWCITAIGAILLALVFAKLSTLFPKSGGPYRYCKEGFGEFIGFQVAYNYWIYMWVGNAAIAVALTGYLSAFFPALKESPFYLFLLAVSSVWFFTCINLVSVKLAGRFQLLLTILKCLPLAFVSVVGCFFIQPDYFVNGFNVSGLSDLQAVSSGATLTLWAFLGLESASIPVDYVDNPKKTVPRATILGTLIAAVIYILSSLAIMGVIPIEQLQQSTAPFMDFANYILGPWGMYAMGVTAVIACAGALNGWILLQGQIPLAAAQDQLFPKQFLRQSKKGGVPVFGMVLSSLLITLILSFNFNKNLVQQFTLIISLATLAAMVAYLYTSIAEFVIYVKYPEKMKNPRAVKRSLIISACAFIYTFWAISNAGNDIVFYGALMMFSSVPVYGFMQWQRYKQQHKHVV